VQISNHFPSPIFAGNKIFSANNVASGALKKSICSAQFTQILTNGTAERTRWLAILDKVASGLTALRC
jgi:mannan endo-1,4-beta-mannosidase